MSCTGMVHGYDVPLIGTNTEAAPNSYTKSGRCMFLCSDGMADITGTTAIPNSGTGISIYEIFGAGGGLIGGPNPGDGITIAFNGGSRVAIGQNVPIPWTILGNSIFSNGGL